MGWGAWWGTQEGGVYVHLRLIHIIVQQKPTHCKEIILQLKVNLKNNIYINSHVIYFKYLTVLFANSVSKNTLILLASPYS